MKLFTILITLFALNARAEVVDEPIIDPELQAEINAEDSGQFGNRAIRRKSPTGNQRLSQGSTGINIYNGQAVAQTTSQSAYQAQPVTQVTDNALNESRADQIRRLRQDAEITTEQKIVEKLEASRLEDEKRRAQALFGNRLNSQPAHNQYVEPAVQTYQQPQHVHQAPAQPQVAVAQEPEPETTLEDVKSEIAQEVRAQMEADRADAYMTKKENKVYVSGLVGMGEYQTDAVDTEGALGFAVGSEMDNRFVVEGSFIYSTHNVERGFPIFDEMEQYNFSVAAKYKLLPGKFSPLAGALMSYTHRNYTTKAVGFYTNQTLDLNFEDQETQSIDLGLIVGADLDVSDSFSIGMDYRYFFNLTSRNNDTPYFDDFAGNRFNIEDENYWFFNITAKVAF